MLPRYLGSDGWGRAWASGQAWVRGVAQRLGPVGHDGRWGSPDGLGVRAVPAEQPGGAAPAGSGGCWPPALRAALPGLVLEWLAEVDSTNSELMRRARRGDLTPTLLVAQTQTAGRGRLGRTWVSAPGEGGEPRALTASLALPLAPADWSGLSLVVGLVVAQNLHPALQIKWPNDLWWLDRKVGGVLIETAAAPGLAAPARWVVVGLGLNLDDPPALAQPAATGAFTMGAVPAVGLRALLPDVRVAEALARVMPPLWQALRTFEATGFRPWQAAWLGRDALAARPVHLSDGRCGVAQGVDATGALLVRQPGGELLRVTSAEVSVRPTPMGAADRAEAAA